MDPNLLVLKGGKTFRKGDIDCDYPCEKVNAGHVEYIRSHRTGFVPKQVLVVRMAPSSLKPSHYVILYAVRPLWDAATMLFVLSSHQNYGPESVFLLYILSTFSSIRREWGAGLRHSLPLSDGLFQRKDILCHAYLLTLEVWNSFLSQPLADAVELRKNTADSS